ncbi:hypothetical protein OG21DRAFT_1482768 [Imleria badia]|nr:hypothetical protein OG21DRAFT_1482768 [Imleria badia]
MLWKGMDSMEKDRQKTIEISGQRPIYSVSFTEDGKQVLGGGVEGMLRRWRVDDGYEVCQAIRAEGATIFAADISADRKWLVCGLRRLDLSDGMAEVRVWDTQTHIKVLDISSHTDTVFSVNVSPDSTKFATGSADKRAFIWSMPTGRRLVGPLWHEGVVVAVQFSPNGDRIATAAAQNPNAKSIRIYNSENGQQLLDVPFRVNTHVSSSLAWSSDGCQLFAASYSEVKRFDTSSGSLLGSWSVPGGGSSASIVLSHSQKFAAVVACQSLSFWDTTTDKQIGTVIKHASSVWSIALSPNDYCVTTGEENGKISFRSLGNILPGSYIMVNLPLMYINEAAFKSWTLGDLNRVAELLTEESARPFHQARALAHRAVVRVRLKQWSMAIDDAKKSTEIRRSIIGHIAHAMAHAGNGEHELAMRVFDLVFVDSIPTENKFLLLVKAIILFECGKHHDAISRVDDLIDIVDNQSLYITVRAQMLLILAGVSLSQGDGGQAMKLLMRAREAIPFQTDPHLVVISLISGWDFDKLALAIQLRLQECIKPSEDNGDAAVQSKKPEDAIIRYSTALSLNPSNPACLLVKRSKAQVMLGLWEDALRDADEAINADPSSPWGYERRHAALHGVQRYDEAINAFTQMISIIEKSHDEDVCQLGKKYMSPSRSETAIESLVREVSKICPIVLIDVESGRLCDEPQRLHTFKSKSQYKELVSSMTEQVDNERILRVVAKYFQYVTFSHVWEGKEPLFQDVNLVTSVWDLDSSPLNEKLKKFCKVVRKDGYRWAWSDTCCIDKTISMVLNESLTMMYKWYQASAATFVFLADVDSPSVLGKLTKSKWMTRAWTTQELLAGKVIRFYDRNWKPYLGDTQSNHKESPEIMQELANAIAIARETITTFNPDDLSVREKLRLASTRHATVEEDLAYSLIGIFKSDIKPHYGEREAALGHLLQEIVARSGDVTVLAWAGKSSPYNSCLPASLSVYSQMPYTLPPIEDAEMDVHVAVLRNLLARADAVLIHDQVTRLPPARFANRRLHLPCIIFAVKKLVVLDLGSGQEKRYRAWVSGIGYVDFETSDQLSSKEPRRLIFVHPWIRDLRDPLDGFSWGGTADHDADEADLEAEAGSAHATELPVQAVPAASTEGYTRALRLVVRLQQPFRALLLQQHPNGEFKRIAAEHEIVIPGLEHGINFSRDIDVDVVEVL